MPIRHAIFLVALLRVPVGSLAAEEEAPVFSGPQVSEKLPALKVTLAYGKEAGRVVDLVEQAAGRPTLLVIVHVPTRPAANLTRSLMNFAEMRGEKLFAGVVYLDNDQSAAERYLRQAGSWWSVGPPVGVSVDGAEGPGSYGLNRNVSLTILVAHEGVVRANFPLIQPSPTDAPKILKEVVALAGGNIPTPAEVAFLSMPTYRPPNVPWRASTTDVKLRELFCAALAAKDDEAARAATVRIEEYVGSDSARQAELGMVASVLLEGQGMMMTGGEGLKIASQLRDWSTKYPPPEPRRRRQVDTKK
jgi:hypothetical protein